MLLGAGSDELTDHVISGPMTVVWAKGQEKGRYSHQTASVFDAGQPADGQHYYEMDVPMYHGSNNRGHFTLDFHSSHGLTLFLSLRLRFVVWYICMLRR